MPLLPTCSFSLDGRIYPAGYSGRGAAACGRPYWSLLHASYFFCSLFWLPNFASGSTHNFTVALQPAL